MIHYEKANDRGKHRISEKGKTTFSLALQDSQWLPMDEIP